MIQKTKVKQAFNRKKIQINVDALNLIERRFSRMVDMWSDNAKNGNVKRVTAETVHLAFGDLERYIGN